MSLSLDTLRKANTKRGIEWMGGPNTVDDILFTVVELGGETGEVLNAVKKFDRWLHKRKGGVSIDQSRQDIADELADVVICADRVAEAMDINLGEAVRAKFNKTSDKYGLSVKLD